MPFIPHTAAEVQDMLSCIGAGSLDDLFDEIPAELRTGELQDVSPGLSEMEMLQLMEQRAATDASGPCFLGAGCYDHHVPAAVWDVTTRGEFMTAYTPYQAEASQGTLQLIYEYQSMMAKLTGMEVANASVYDGASALGEAILMALRANKRSVTRRVLVPASLHPHYRQAANSICRHQGIEFDTMALAGDGRIDAAALDASDQGQVAAVIVQQPNFFGQLEDVDAITDWAAGRDALVIAVVNPLAMALFKPAGEWGSSGADIVCGDGQPLGIPMASGGPSFGFMCCRQRLVRQLPGRLVGRTEDLDGRAGFTLTLQAREQHIRRAKATSNICTNQGLLVTAATIHMAILGASGLARVAARCHVNTRRLVAALTDVDGVSQRFDGPYFHECVLSLPRSAAEVVDGLIAHDIVGGLALGHYHPDMANDLLVCATERRTDADIEAYARALATVLAA